MILCIGIEKGAEAPVVVCGRSLGAAISGDVVTCNGAFDGGCASRGSRTAKPVDGGGWDGGGCGSAKEVSDGKSSGDGSVSGVEDEGGTAKSSSVGDGDGSACGIDGDGGDVFGGGGGGVARGKRQTCRRIGNDSGFGSGSEGEAFSDLGTFGVVLVGW